MGGGEGGAADAESQVRRGKVVACTEERIPTVVLSVNLKIKRIPMVGLVVNFSVIAVAFMSSEIVTFARNSENRSKAAAKVEEESMLAAVREGSVVEGHFI